MEKERYYMEKKRYWRIICEKLGIEYIVYAYGTEERLRVFIDESLPDEEEYYEASKKEISLVKEIGTKIYSV